MKAELIKRLKHEVAFDKKWNKQSNGNEASFGYEQGMVISRNEAELVIKALKQYKEETK